METDLKNKAIELIRKTPLATIATLWGGTPHATSIFAVVDSSFVIHFATREDTQKWRNITERDAVALVFTNEATQETLQIRGKASRESDVLAEGKAIKDLIAMTFRHADWILPIDKQVSEGGYVIVRVVPEWGRYTSYLGKTVTKGEILF